MARATTEIYTLSLHDALPIYAQRDYLGLVWWQVFEDGGLRVETDRKSTRLNSSHVAISYAVLCLKKKHHDHGPDADVLDVRGDVLAVQVRLEPDDAELLVHEV